MKKTLNILGQSGTTCESSTLTEARLSESRRLVDRRANDILMATAFNERFSKNKHMSSGISGMSANSSRSRQRVSTTNYEKANHRSFHDGGDDAYSQADGEERSHRYISGRNRPGPLPDISNFNDGPKENNPIKRPSILRARAGSGSKQSSISFNGMNNVSAEAPDLRSNSHHNDRPPRPPGVAPPAHSELQYYDPANKQAVQYAPDPKFTSHEWPNNKGYVDIRVFKNAVHDDSANTNQAANSN